MTKRVANSESTKWAGRVRSVKDRAETLGLQLTPVQSLEQGKYIFVGADGEKYQIRTVRIMRQRNRYGSKTYNYGVWHIGFGKNPSDVSYILLGLFSYSGLRFILRIPRTEVVAGYTRISESVTTSSKWKDYILYASPQALERQKNA